MSAVFGSTKDKFNETNLCDSLKKMKDTRVARLSIVISVLLY